MELIKKLFCLLLFILIQANFARDGQLVSVPIMMPMPSEEEIQERAKAKVEWEAHKQRTGRETARTRLAKKRERLVL